MILVQLKCGLPGQRIKCKPHAYLNILILNFIYLPTYVAVDKVLIYLYARFFFFLNLNNLNGSGKENVESFILDVSVYLVSN